MLDHPGCALLRENGAIVAGGADDQHLGDADHIQIPQGEGRICPGFATQLEPTLHEIERRPVGALFINRMKELQLGVRACLDGAFVGVFDAHQALGLGAEQIAGQQSHALRHIELPEISDHSCLAFEDRHDGDASRRRAGLGCSGSSKSDFPEQSEDY